MDVSQISTSATPVTTSTTKGNSVLSSDFEVFLTMLTAQAEYQDPLEPIDSSEYAAQLAQFSMVEQQVTTNDLMEQLLAAMGASDMSGAANWIGMEALVQGPAKFDGSPVTIALDPPITADEVNLIVYNAQGNEVQRKSLPLGTQSYDWTGVNANGTLFASGEYHFEVESRSNGSVLTAEPAMTYARVTEARIANGETLLVLESGNTVKPTNISGLREPI